MYLKGGDLEKVAMDIVTKGGEDFLKIITFKDIKSKRGHPKCCLCKARIQAHLYVLAGIKNKEVYDDQFCSLPCAMFAHRWLHEVMNFYITFLGLNQTLGEIRDSLPIEENESMRDYRKRYKEYAKKLLE